MSLPARLQYSFEPGAAVPMLAAATAVASVFAATPFLIPEVADRFDVSVGLAGGISLVQVSAFALVTFALPRLATPSVGVYRAAGVLLAAGNALSAASAVFPILLATRALVGGAAGALTWLAWSEAMRRPRSLASLSAAGPTTALIASPIIAALSVGGDRVVFLTLAAAAVPLLLLRPAIPAQARPTRSFSKSRSNRVILVALLFMTFFGAALFIYEAVAADEVHGLNPVAASFAFSLNAAGGLLGARLSNRHRRPGLWLATAGPAAALSILGGHPFFYFFGLAWWGFAFWMGVPGVMQMLAARSLEPAERAGDAQAAMAAGRALAPVLGGAFADQSSYGALAVVAGTGLTLAGLGIVGVQEGRDRLPPTEPMAVGP
jgi:predicted MFS family arabinose efflux permease